MSPLWRDQIRIALCPDKVVLVRMKRGWRPQIVDKRIIPCKADPLEEAAWRAPLAALKDALPSFASRRADSATILSNAFVRYMQVPWNAQLSGEEEELAYVRHCFGRIYGDSARHWTLRLSQSPPGDPRIASAVDHQLLDGLAGIFQGCELRAGSIQPYLMAAFNQWRVRFRGITAWFALMESGRLCLAMFHQNRWHNLRILKAGPDWYEKLHLILNREHHLLDIAEAPREVFLFAPEETELTLAVDKEWAVHQLTLPSREGFSPSAEAAYSLAIGG